MLWLFYMVTLAHAQLWVNYPVKMHFLKLVYCFRLKNRKYSGVHILANRASDNALKPDIHNVKKSHLKRSHQPALKT
jgi:hypothetical protein